MDEEIRALRCAWSGVGDLKKKVEGRQLNRKLDCYS
jgi:hypothetical protein